MSYDIRLSVKVEGCDRFAEIAEPELPSPTYNLGKMFRACTGWNFTQGEQYKCSEVIDMIDRGIRELRFNRAEYEKYNPKNGWGDISGAIRVLESLRKCIYENAEDIPLNCLYVCW